MSGNNGDRSSLLPPGSGMDYSQFSRRYGPAASTDPVPSTASLLGGSPGPGSRLSSASRLSAPRSSFISQSSRMTTSSVSDGWGWNDPEADDYLHNPDPRRDRKNDRGGSIFTLRGVANIGCLLLLLLCLITLFAGYPIITFYTESHQVKNNHFNVGSTNATGQAPLIAGFPDPIDPDTPEDARTRTGFDGQHYELVFSDEFNKDGRTFFPGDDPYWTAVDIHYWPTGDLEWYDPTAATTEGGSLKLTMTQETINDLQWKSGMLQSWNKLCFQWSYYMEVSVSLPGNNRVPGFWPGVWTMGNLGRPGYGASTHGTWPYTYTDCDVGTLPNQSWPESDTAHVTPPAALNTGWNSGTLSFLPGQRLSACTCPGEVHPGPDVSVGRGAPEIDVIEASVERSRRVGTMSQSAQVAPFDDYYQYNNASTAVEIYNNDITNWNGYLGGPFQQAISGVTDVGPDVYTGTSGNFNLYGVEVYADKKDPNAGYITWMANGVKTWTMKAAAVGPNPRTQIGQRLVSEEPMTMILNFGMSTGFSPVDLMDLKWPATMLVDYVRVYQIPGYGAVGCDPDDHPTATYIATYADAYNNPNLTTWEDAKLPWPKNRLVDKC